jgi:DNA-binding SARP family transcriptional activator
VIRHDPPAQIEGVSAPQLDEASSTRIRLIGTLHATIAGRRVDDLLPGPKGRVLFTFLVLNRHRPCSRDELVGVLWPNDRPASPEGALSTLLTRLRHAVGEGVVEGRGALSLRLPDDALIDVDEVQRHVAAAREALGRGDAGHALEQARRAYALTAGEMLPGADGTWLEEARRELAEFAVTALELSARAGIAIGGSELAGAKGAARRLIDCEPYRESGYALLMEVHARVGDVAEALRVFERVRVLLRDELGARPSPGLLALHQQLLTGGIVAEARRDHPAGAGADGSVRLPERVPLPSILARRAAAAFVGRDTELQTLERLWREATPGARFLVLVSGDPGMGKTALAARFAARVHADGATVLYGQCDEHSVAPYEPIVEALRGYWSHSETLDAARQRPAELGELARVVPELRDHLREPPAFVPGEPDVQRYRLFESVRAILARAAEDRPILLVLDDVHWADRSTLLMLRHFLRPSERDRLVVLATYRPVAAWDRHPLNDALEELQRVCPSQRLVLEGLGERDSGALIEAYVGSTPRPQLVRHWYRRTEGHPFFLHEILRSTDRVAINSSWEADLPPSVTEMIAARIRRLGGASVAALSAAAVIGRDFNLDVLAALLDESAESTLDALEAAVGHGLVVEVPDQFDRFSFSHALVREALYEQHSRSRRARLHLRVGEILERGAGHVSPAELARHFFSARDVAGHEKAVRYSAQAAAAAFEALAYEEAVAHYQRALQILKRVGPTADEQRLHLLLGLGEAQRRAGDADVDGTFRLAAQLARERGDAKHLALAALGGRHFESGAPDDERVALLSEALAALGTEDSVLRVRVLARLAEALHFNAAGDRAELIGQKAVEMARRLEDTDAMIAALSGRHAALLHVDHVEVRLPVLHELASLAERTGHRDLATHSHQWSTYALLELGDYDGARREHRLFATLAEELRQPHYDHVRLAWKAVFAQLDGRLADAERMAQEGYELAERVQGIDAVALFAAQLFFIRREQLRLAELVPGLQAFVGDAELPAWRAGLTIALAAAEDEDGARRSLARSADSGLDRIPRDLWWLPTMALLAEGCAAVGDAVRAAELYGALRPYAQRSVQVAFAAHLGSVQRNLGVLATVMGDWDRGSRHFDAALERHVAADARALVVRTLCDYVRMLRLARRPRDGARAEALRARAMKAAAGSELQRLVDALEDQGAVAVASRRA